jgi:hypothetical protein
MLFILLVRVIRKNNYFYYIIGQTQNHTTNPCKIIRAGHTGLVAQWPWQALPCLSVLVRALVCTQHLRV